MFNEGFGMFNVVSEVGAIDKFSGSQNNVESRTPESKSNNDAVNLEIEIDGNITRQVHRAEEPREPEVRRSTRQNKGIAPVCLSYVVKATQSEPQSWQDMLKLPESEKEKWLNAANDEIKLLTELRAWELTALPPDENEIGCKWIF